VQIEAKRGEEIGAEALVGYAPGRLLLDLRVFRQVVKRLHDARRGDGRHRVMKKPGDLAHREPSASDFATSNFAPLFIRLPPTPADRRERAVRAGPRDGAGRAVAHG